MTEDEVVGELRDGMTLGIGGWGSRRKPMSLVRAIARSNLRDLTVVSYGGPDVGLLCATGKIRRLVFGFVSLDTIPLDPHFRNARERGTIAVEELDEGMLQLGLRAAAWNLPFLPTRAGLGSDVLRVNPGLKLVTSPYEPFEQVVAVPPIRLDAAIVHMNRATVTGAGQYLGPDPYFDEWFCRAAKRAYVSCERLGLEDAGLQTLLLDRTIVHGVVEAPGGAWFTECAPDYPRDEALQRTYAASAKDAAKWAEFAARYL